MKRFRCPNKISNHNKAEASTQRSVATQNNLKTRPRDKVPELFYLYL